MELQTVNGQSVNSTLKAGLVNAVSGGSSTDGNNTSTAFASLLQVVGARYGASANNVLASLETSLMQSDTTPPPARPAQTQDNDDDQDNSSTVDQSKTSKSDDSSNNSSGDNTAAHAASAAQDAANAHAHDASQAQVAVEAQAAVVAPVVATTQTQTTTTTDATDETAVAATATTPVDPNAQVAAATPQTQVAANAPITAPQAAAAAAPVVQQIATPVVTAPQAASAAAKTQPLFGPQTKSDVSAANDDSQHSIGGSDTTQVVQDPNAGQQPLRSAAAQAQATSLAKTLDPNAKVQVQVQTTVASGPATPVTPTFNPYDHYSGYQAPTDAGTTANGQVGVTDPTNALVDTGKSVTDLPTVAPLAAVILPPQLQSQVSQPSPTASFRAEAAAPIQALESTASTQNNTQNQSEAGAGFEAFNNSAGSATAATKTASTASTQPQAPVTAQQVVDQIKVNITRAAKAGVDKVSIQLKPEELGRIDVKLEMTSDQKVSVTVTADNKETLQLLQNDSSGLERALNDAGLRTDSSNLSFNLRSDSDPQSANQNAGGSTAQNNGNSYGTDDAAEDAGFTTYDYAGAARTRGGVDTFA